MKINSDSTVTIAGDTMSVKELEQLVLNSKKKVFLNTLRLGVGSIIHFKDREHGYTYTEMICQVSSDKKRYMLIGMSGNRYNDTHYSMEDLLIFLDENTTDLKVVTSYTIGGN